MNNKIILNLIILTLCVLAIVLVYQYKLSSPKFAAKESIVEIGKIEKQKDIKVKNLKRSENIENKFHSQNKINSNSRLQYVIENPSLYNEIQLEYIMKGRTGDKSIYGDLDILLSSNEKWLQLFAIKTLVSIASEESLFLLANSIDHANKSIKIEISQKLARIHEYQYNQKKNALEKIEANLIGMLNSGDYDGIYSELVSSLLGLSLPSGINWALDKWENASGSEKKILEKAFHLIYKHESISTLGTCLMERLNVSIICGNMLANIGSPDAVKLMFRWFELENRDSRQLKIWLSMLSERKSLETMLEQAHSFKSSHSALFNNINEMYKTKINDLKIEIL